MRTVGRWETTHERPGENWIHSDNRLRNLASRWASSPVNERTEMDEEKVQEAREMLQEALETCDKAIRSAEKVLRRAERMEERHQEELRQAESRREGIFPPLFSR